MDRGKVKVFLCTNKHVLNKTKELREKATKVILHLNVKEVEGKIIGKPYELPLIWPDGKKRWKEHPEADIDVLVLDVTDLVVSLPDMEKKWADYSLFADSKILSEQDITIGEEVMVVGYPLGFKQGDSNFPIVRQGIVASQIGQKFIEESIERDGKKKTRVIRGFLIDGGLIPGSSGSPVVLKPVTGRFVGNNIVMGVPPPYLLGIVAETRYAPIRTNVGDIPSYAGIGLAFDALTVKETIELFFK
jgi:S1-C subfamily serine protease